MRLVKKQILLKKKFQYGIKSEGYYQFFITNSFSLEYLIVALLVQYLVELSILMIITSNTSTEVLSHVFQMLLETAGILNKIPLYYDFT